MAFRLHAWLVGTAALVAACTNDAGPDADSDEAGDADTSGEETGETGEEELPEGSPCDQQTPAPWLEVAPPEPPGQSYALPDFEWVEVEDSAGLQAAVSDGAEHIRLASGFYAADELDGPVLQLAGHKLWAAEAGGPRLEFAVQVGGNNSDAKDFGDAELHGLVFDVHDPAHAATGAADQLTAIMAWGDATGLVVEDVEIFANEELTAGLYTSAPDRLRVARFRVTDATRYGVCITGETPTAPALLEDLRVTDIHGGEGKHEGIGLHLGAPAEVRRAYIREVRVAGIMTNGSTEGTLLTDLDIDRVGLADHENGGGMGVYFENTTRETILERFCIGSNTRIGVNSEWDHSPADDAFPRGVRNVVRDGLIESWFAGVHFDQGTVDGRVEGVVFRNYQRAGIIFYNNVSAEELWPVYDDGSLAHDNFFALEEIHCARCDLTRTRWNASGSVQCEGDALICP